MNQISSNNEVKEISVDELHEKINNNDDFVLIDVRRDEEYNLSNISNARHIPLDQLQDHIKSLDNSKEYVMQCRSGGRSAKATLMLQHEGFNNVSNLKGGLIEWSEKIDPTIKVK
mgnify:FL=1